MGSLAVLMVQHLSGGSLGSRRRRVLEASSESLPLMALLFIPICLESSPSCTSGRKPLEKLEPKAAEAYIQARPPISTSRSSTHVRAVGFFVIWGALIFLLNKWSKEQDERPAVATGPEDRRSRVLSGPGLVLYVVTVTFMSRRLDHVARSALVLDHLRHPDAWAGRACPRWRSPSWCWRRS